MFLDTRCSHLHTDEYTHAEHRRINKHTHSHCPRSTVVHQGCVLREPRVDSSTLVLRSCCASVTVESELLCGCGGVLGSQAGWQHHQRDTTVVVHGEGSATASTAPLSGYLRSITILPRAFSFTYLSFLTQDFLFSRGKSDE